MVIGWNWSGGWGGGWIGWRWLIGWLNLWICLFVRRWMRSDEEFCIGFVWVERVERVERVEGGGEGVG